MKCPKCGEENHLLQDVIASRKNDYDVVIKGYQCGRCKHYWKV